MLTRKQLFQQPITNVAQAKAWIEAMADRKWTVHLDDEIERGMLGGLSKQEFEDINQRRAETHRIDGDWGIFDCPNGYMLACMYALGFLET